MSTSATSFTRDHYKILSIGIVSVVTAISVLIVAFVLPPLPVPQPLALADYSSTLGAYSEGIKSVVRNNYNTLKTAFEKEVACKVRDLGNPMTNSDVDAFIMLMIKLKSSAKGSFKDKLDSIRGLFAKKMELGDYAGVIFWFAQQADFVADKEYNKDDHMLEDDLVVYTERFSPQPLPTYSADDRASDMARRQIRSLGLGPVKHNKSVQVAGSAYHENSEAVKKPAKHEGRVTERVLRFYGQDFVGVTDNQRIIAVADGVSTGDDSYYASMMVVHLIIELFEKAGNSASLQTHTWHLLNSILQIMQPPFISGGKTTLTVAQVDRSTFGGAKLHVLSIGDTGCMVVDKHGKILAKTAVGEHSENCPYQLPSSLKTKNVNELLERAKLYEFDVPSGARIILYSDGVVDNLWDETVAACSSADQVVDACLKVIRNKGVLKSDGKESITPIKQSRNLPYKKDDISVAIIGV